MKIPVQIAQKILQLSKGDALNSSVARHAVMDELIAESRALGWDDLAGSMEKLRHLETPEGQKALERREKRLSRL